MTMTTQFRLTMLAIAVSAALAVQSVAAAVKVRTDFNKKFDFRQAHTWAWNPSGEGKVMVARTSKDDPEEVKRLAEPYVLKAVDAEVPRHGLTAAPGKPDLILTYYLLLTIGSTAQTMGQFLPATTQWGVPPFTPNTQSLEFIEQGSLVLDFSANGEVVWRGVGEAKIPTDLSTEKRAALIGEAVKKILEKYPPKQ
jgi:hypothetical protein